MRYFCDFQLVQLAIVFKKDLPSGKLAVWEMIESPDELYPQLRCEVPIFRNNKQRNLEWVSSRILLQSMVEENFKIEKDEFGKPHLSNSDEQISLTHCQKFTAAIVSDRPTGVDIEHVNPRIERIASRFLNASEAKFLRPYNSEERLQYLYAIWCAKEAVYKAYGRRAVDFADHMNVLPFKFEERKLSLTLSKESEVNYTVAFELFDEHVLAYTVD